MSANWLLEHWKAYRLKQKAARETLELSGRWVWRKQGTIELVATFTDEATAVEMLLKAGYRRRDNIFRP